MKLVNLLGSLPADTHTHTHTRTHAHARTHKEVEIKNKKRERELFHSGQDLNAITIQQIHEEIDKSQCFAQGML